ncbi:MAG: ribosome biogenesis GTPase Der [Armatimonadetes bacterium]|jgi:GTP-binding protein|nr:ribosome biogenesis GTPase Der [Armatimonadota bacterium]
MPKPVVAIVGRPNVGKSTLFNRIVGERLAIVEDTPGVTRDRMYASVEWNGRPFTLVDTGGIVPDGMEFLQSEVYSQANIAVDEADVIVLMVDALEGPSPVDASVADVLRRAGKPVLVAANKADNARREADTIEFYSLGLGDLHAISALNGRAVADLLDAVVELLPEHDEDEEDDTTIRLALVGRPNVGKSSLLNALLGRERAIVSSTPGTTRDAVDTTFEHEGDRFTIVDTAGIRRRGQIAGGGIEFYMALRAQKAIERADVAVILVDADEGPTDGDARVAGMANDAGRACVIVVNKWDLVHATQMHAFAKEVQNRLPFIEYAPIVFTSALTGRGVKDVLPTVKTAADNHALRISTPELNRVIRNAVDARPYTRRGRDLKVKYASQIRIKPPTIGLWVNDPQIPHPSYERYLINQLRKEFGFVGTPLRLVFRRSSEKDDPR